MSKVLEVQAQETSGLLERQSNAYDEVIREFGRKLTEEVAGALRENAKAAAGEMQAATKTFRKGLEALGASREKAEAGLQSSLVSFRAVVDQIRSTTAENSKATEASYRILAARSSKASQSMAAASDTFERAIAQAHRVIEEAQASAKSSRASARQGEQALWEHAEGVTRALGQLETALSDRADAIAKLPLTIPEPAVAAPVHARSPVEASTRAGAGAPADDRTAVAPQTPALASQVPVLAGQARR